MEPNDDVAVPYRCAELAHRALQQRWTWYAKHGHAVPRDLDEALRAFAAVVGAKPPPKPFYGLSERPWK